MQEQENFDQVIEKLCIGQVVSFKSKHSFFKVTGELKDFYWHQEHLFLEIYSLLLRKSNKYVLNRELILVPASEVNIIPFPEPSNWVEDWEKQKLEEERPFFLRRKTTTIIALLLLAIFTYPFISSVRWPFLIPKENYKEFIKKELTIPQVYNTVRRRMIYLAERGDNWNSPETAWKLGQGDCEEFAAICSDYLTNHGYENYLVGLTPPDKNTGHAVVFVRTDNYFTIVDLNKSSESFGINQLKEAKTLEQAVSLYSTLPANIYEIPQRDGEKKVRGVIHSSR